MLLQKPMLGTQLDRSDSLNNPVLDLLFNEGHGDVVHDLSGWGNHGTLHGFDFPPTQASGWNPGMDGVAVKFDGDNDIITIPHSESLNVGNVGESYSVGMLIYSDDVTTEQCLMDNRSGSDDSIYLRLYNGDLYGFLRADYPDYNYNVKTPISIGWSFVTFVKEITSIVVYVNAVPSSSVTVSDQDYRTTSPLRIGKRDGTAIPFFGMVASTYLLPRAMSPFEVVQMQIDPYGVYLQ